MRADLPIVVDLDGTLIRSDLLLEGFLSLLGKDPLSAMAAATGLLSGKAAFKERVARSAPPLDAKNLPFNENVLSYLMAEKSRGRALYLASASNGELVGAVAEHLGIFDGWIASTATDNLKGARKAEKLVEMFGEQNFDYIGNDGADIPVWKKADKALIVGACPSLARRLKHDREIQNIPSGRNSIWPWLRLLRPHQWSKNVLIFVPILTSHKLTTASLIEACIAFVAFSLSASSVYVMNDLVDIQADRAHPAKRNRPFASGTVPIVPGMTLGLMLCIAAFLVGSTLSPLFLGVLALYLSVNVAYTLVLKRKMLIDVVTLAGLYTVRVVAGATAIDVTMSKWLFAFSLFIFLFLALIKRHSEMVMRLNTGLADPSNRTYKSGDVPVIASLAAAAGYSAVIVFALYISSDLAVSQYRHADYLWLACPIIVYWISRVLLMSQRYHIREDPVLFAIRDRVTWMAAGVIFLLGLVAL